MSTDLILFNISAFIAGLVVLEKGADLFVDNTALLAKCLGISEVLIALLTAGAEWEELAVVIASVIQHRPALAIGNVVGSSISNILGAFSIGLLFQSGVTKFDKSSKLYTAILFIVTSVVSLLGIFRVLSKPLGGLLNAAFAIYIGLVCWSIYRGVLTAPEDSDTDSDSNTDSRSSIAEDDLANPPSLGSTSQPQHAQADESTPLVVSPQRTKGISSPLLKLLVGFIALSLSGYILSHSSGTLAAALGISESIFGATLLSLATTLPEKFVAIVSGSRGYQGVLVANTVGSNIFLLTLCLGVTLLGAGPGVIVTIRINEIAWMWGSSLLLSLIVVLGSRRIFGVIMLATYVVFLVLEFTVHRD